MSVYIQKDRSGKAKSPFYQYDFVIKGVRFHGSTGATSEREAVRVEKLRREEARAEVERVGKIDPTSLDAAFGRFWHEKGQHDADSQTTFERMERLQDELRRILTQRGRPHVLGEISDDVIAAYVARRRGHIGRNKKLLSPATVNREIQVLRRIMRRAANVWKHPIVLPAWGEHLAPEADERIAVMSAPSEADFLSHLREDFRPLARFLIMTGLRVGSACALTPADVDFEHDMLSIRTKSKRPGGKLQVLPITTAMKVLLANELPHARADALFTFVAERTLKPKGYVRGQRYAIKPQWFYREVKAAATEIGRPDLRVHDLRHVAGTRTTMATKNLRVTQSMLGHSRISTTTKYAHVLLDDLREAMEATHSPGKNPGTKIVRSVIDMTLKRKRKLDQGS